MQPRFPVGVDRAAAGGGVWLDYQDSNLDKQNQNLLCCHYTIVQTVISSANLM